MKVLVSQSREVSSVDSYKFLGVKQTLAHFLQQVVRRSKEKKEWCGS